MVSLWADGQGYKKIQSCSTLSWKISWNFTKKDECDNIIGKWYISFKISNYKRRNFLNILNNDLSNIKLSYTKEGSWIEQFGFSNLLCVQATWAITNHKEKVVATRKLTVDISN